MSEEVQGQEAQENPRPDTPAAAHQKKLAQEAAAKKKANELKKLQAEGARKLAKEKGEGSLVQQLQAQPIFYTKRGNKVLEIEVRENGTYTRYVGNAKKHKADFDAKLAVWKKAKVWVGEEEVVERARELREKHFGVKAE